MNDNQSDELTTARETIARLNRRCQMADAAVSDAKRVIQELIRGSQKGTPWCGGSLGRAFLAYENSKLSNRISELEESWSGLRANTDSKTEQHLQPTEETSCPN